MNVSKSRRSDRAEIELPISVSGTDGEGHAFLEEAVTVAVSRQGAKIALSRKLLPEQEVTLRVLGSRREETARVVGQTGSFGEVHHYGLELLSAGAAEEFWGIEFPEPEAGPFARAILECTHCQSREMVYLNELEAEVLEVNERLTRFCKRCTDDSLWKPARVSPREAQAPADSVQPAVGPKRTRNDRAHVRVGLRVEVGIRHPQSGDEVAITENVSRGGLRFRSTRAYAVGSIIQAAFPYTHGGGNVYVPAQIVYAETLPDENTRVYGVAYVPNPEAGRRR